MRVTPYWHCDVRRSSDGQAEASELPSITQLSLVLLAQEEHTLTPHSVNPGEAFWFSKEELWQSKTNRLDVYWMRRRCRRPPSRCPMMADNAPTCGTVERRSCKRSHPKRTLTEPVAFLPS